nr:uncharacterized protein LOC113829932 [Penaeus vannamei]
MDDSTLETEGYDNTNEFISVKEEIIEDVSVENCQEIKKEVISYEGEENAIFIKAENKTSTSECPEIADVEANKSEENAIFIKVENKIDKSECPGNADVEVNKSEENAIFIKAENKTSTSECREIADVEANKNSSDVLMCDYEDPLKIMPFVVKDCGNVNSSEGGQEASQNFKEKVTHLTLDKKGKSFVCEVCCKTFLYNGHLLLHMSVHTKKHSCEVCCRTFAKKSHQVAHMRVHTKEKPNKCKICSKAFSHKHHLKQHMRIHTKEKPYSCEECDKKFSKRDAVVVHMRIHTKEKPYTCEVCCKAFTQKHHLAKHMRMHTKYERKLYCIILVMNTDLVVPGDRKLDLEATFLCNRWRHSPSTMRKTLRGDWASTPLLFMVYPVYPDYTTIFSVCNADYVKTATKSALGAGPTLPMRRPQPAAVSEREPQFSVTLTGHPAMFIFSGVSCRQIMDPQINRTHQKHKVSWVAVSSATPKGVLLPPNPAQKNKESSKNSWQKRASDRFGCEYMEDSLVIWERSCLNTCTRTVSVSLTDCLVYDKNWLDCKNNLLACLVNYDSGKRMLHDCTQFCEDYIPALSDHIDLFLVCVRNELPCLYIDWLEDLPSVTSCIIMDDMIEFISIKEERIEDVSEENCQEIKKEFINCEGEENAVFIKTENKISTSECPENADVQANKSDSDVLMCDYEDPLKIVPLKDCGNVTSSEGGQEAPQNFKEKVTHLTVDKKGKIFVCEVCCKTFSYNGHLLIHMRVHTKEKPYSCEVCSKAFSKKSHQVAHMRVHTKEKPYECKVCSKAFSHKHHLEQHMRVHTKEKPYSCEECSKKFSQRDALVVHRRVHTKEKPYTCEVCCKAFSQKQHLEKHMRIHMLSNRKQQQLSVQLQKYSITSRNMSHNFRFPTLRSGQISVPFLNTVFNSNITFVFFVGRDLNPHFADRLIQIRCGEPDYQVAEVQLNLKRFAVYMRTNGKDHPGNKDLSSNYGMTQAISCKLEAYCVLILQMYIKVVQKELKKVFCTTERICHICMAGQSTEQTQHQVLLHVGCILYPAVNTWRFVFQGREFEHNVIGWEFVHLKMLMLFSALNIVISGKTAPNMNSLHLDTKMHEDTVEFVSVEEKNIEGVFKGNDKKIKVEIIDQVYEEDITFIKTEDDVNANECSVFKETETVHMETIENDTNISGNKCEDPLKVSEVENREETFSSDGDQVTHKETEKNGSLQVDRKGKRFMCVLCCKKYTYRYELLKHARVHTKERPYSCDICSNAFAEKRTLMRHMLVHTKEKPFNCEICDKPFSRKSEIKLHMRVHTKEKPYSCEICGKMFTMKGNLGIHMRIHTGEKPYSCERCNRAFCRKSDLIVHIRTHTKEKPYTCEVCSKTFSEKGHLKSHMRVHTKEKPYKCEVCYKAFSQKHHVDKHMGVHTKLKPNISKFQLSDRENITEELL